MWSCLYSLHYDNVEHQEPDASLPFLLRLLDAGMMEVGWCSFKTDRSPGLLLQLRESPERYKGLNLNQQASLLLRSWENSKEGLILFPRPRQEAESIPAQP